MKLSIVIPVYHVEKYIQRCLESLMSQDLAGSEVECILVDDCGVDGSMDIVRRTIEAYHGPICFQVLSHDVNRGLSAARNTGVSHSTGDYVLFMDSDDYLTPDGLTYLLQQQQAHPEADLVIGNALMKKDGKLLHPNLSEPWLIDSPDIFFRRMLRHQIYLYAWNKLIRRSVLTENKVTFIEGILYEDQSWSYHLFSVVSSVLLLPQVTYIYEWNDSSIVHAQLTLERADKTVNSYIISTRWLLQHRPIAQQYAGNMAVDYLLFIANYLQNAIDIAQRNKVSPDVLRHLRTVKTALLLRSLRYGRMLVTLFLLTLFWPLRLLQWLFNYRHHYYEIEWVVNRLAHLADPLHRKNSL